MARYVLVLAALLTAAAPGSGQELLSNPSFELPAVSGPCARSVADVTEWKRGTGATQFLNDRNDYVSGWYQPTCPRVPGDTAYGSRQAYGTPGEPRRVFQTVNGLTPGQFYAFTGFWSMGHQDATDDILCKAELYDGADYTAPLIASVSLSQGQGWQDWLPFGVVGAPTGTTMTVLVSAYNTGGAAWCFHIDGFSLMETTCTSMPTITELTPAFGVRGSIANMTIHGSGFVDGQTVVTLSRPDEPWPGPQNITATNVVVAGDGNSLTCDFDLTGAASGAWNVVVTLSSPGCEAIPAMRLNAFLVVLPSLSNGSFELPTAPGGCPATPLPEQPTDWVVTPLGNYADGGGNSLFRDSDRFPPACPPPDGVHYGSSLSNANDSAGAEAHLHQTISVTPGSEYTFSGMFAGGGRNECRIELYDGDATGTLLNSTTIFQWGYDTETYNWTPAFVSATPTAPYMTVMWRVNLTGNGPHVAHADGLALNVCSSAGPHPTIYAESPLSTAICGQPYVHQLFGCSLGNKTWSLVGGQLPWGLTMDATGLITGIAIAGSAGFTVQMVDDYDGGSVTKELHIPVSGLCCSIPPADSDYDFDVDMKDFGLFQACYTFASHPLRAECACFDMARPGESGTELGQDGIINDLDLSVFVRCSSGPEVDADDGCAGDP